MPELALRLVRYSQKDTPAFPEVNEKSFVEHLELHGMVILERATSGGKPSVEMVLKDSKGGFYTIQTTAAIMDAVAQAINGAQKFWNDNPE